MTPEDHCRKKELDLIDAAVSAGRVRRFPLGATTDFDSKPFRERRVMLFSSKKRKVSLLTNNGVYQHE